MGCRRRRAATVAPLFLHVPDVHLTREKWKEAVDRMEGMGTEVPGGKKLSALLDYLERTHGPAGAAPAEKK